MEWAWFAGFVSAFLIGLSKAGFKGLSFVFVGLLAYGFGAKDSTGIMLPLLMLGDVMAIIYYRKNVNWPVLWQLFVPMAVGVLIGVYIGDDMPVETFKRLMALVILIGGIFMFWYLHWAKDQVPKAKWFAILMGLGAGFCTMIGNLAGAFSNIFFLAMRFPKEEFIGTAAWLFFFINIFKLPFHIWVWQTITSESLWIDIYLSLAIIIGFGVGLFLIRFLSNRLFQQYVLWMTLLGSLLLLI